MRLFVCGNQSPTYIQETLSYLDDNYDITEICGSATSRCMDTIIPWAEGRSIPLSLYMPMSDSIRGMIALNAEIIENENPFAVMIYSEEPEVVSHLIEDAHNSPSVQYVIKEIK